MKKRSGFFALATSAVLLVIAAVPAQASHSWNNYHWARTANPFTLKLGDNVTSAWDSYLSTASSDWTASSVLNTTIVAGSAGNVKRCSPPAGRVEVCNSKYGFNGWLGIAGITLSGGHITSGYVKLNDSYFNTSSYNTPAWRLFVTCQEIGHTLGLDHTDENFGNPNQGTCMDYTNDPDGPPSNEHPNAHDYDQLASIYAHLDGNTTVGSATPSGPGRPSRSRSSNVDAHGNGTVTWTLWVE
ncbi:MAG: hypothetical protein ACRDJM_04605 [Actinomycetota bacterium]